MFFESTAVLSFVIIIAIFSVLYWIIPQKYNWFAYLVLTVLLSYMAFNLVPNESDDLYRYYKAIDDFRINGWDKVLEYVEHGHYDMDNYFTIRYLFWFVSRLNNNHWLQTIVVAFVYGSSSVMILLAQKRFNINRGYVYVGSLFFLSTYWYYDVASGIRNGLCFSIVVFCSYIMFVEKKFIPLCIIGYIIAFFTHSSSIVAISLVIVTVILKHINSAFVNFVFMFSLIAGNFIVQTLAENSSNSLLLSIAGRAEKNVGGNTISINTQQFVHFSTMIISIFILLYVGYYFNRLKNDERAFMFFKYTSLTIYLVVGSIYSQLLYVRFVRWIVPILICITFMIGMQKQEDDIAEKGSSYYNFYAIPIERALYKLRPVLIIVVVVYSLIHLWYDYSGSSLTFAHFGYEWEQMGIYDYTW